MQERLLALATMGFLCAACGGDDHKKSAGGGVSFLCEQPASLPCEDELFLDLNLQSNASAAVIVDVADGAGWTSHIDASAGGSSPTESYVYAKFTDAGLEGLNITDLNAIESMIWDIAFRRYVIRLNSGDSGPSCVKAARLPVSITYDDVTEVPSGAVYQPEDFYDGACMLDRDGLGGPVTALSSFWTMPQNGMCVMMTYDVFVLELRDARHVKLMVTHYYADADQENCQHSGSGSMATAANLQVRWAYLD